MNNQKIQERLEYLRGEIRAERISYGEIAELQSLAQYIDAGDVELLEWASVPENKRDTQAEKWHSFQNFQSFLSLDEVKQVRRHLIAIEKALFTK